MSTLRSLIPRCERQDISSVLAAAIQHICHITEENEVSALHGCHAANTSHLCVAYGLIVRFLSIVTGSQEQESILSHKMCTLMGCTNCNRRKPSLISNMIVFNFMLLSFALVIPIFSMKINFASVDHTIERFVQLSTQRVHRTFFHEQCNFIDVCFKFGNHHAQ